MSISVRWYDETKTIILFALGGEYRPDELTNAYRELYELTKTVDHKVGVIKDMRSGQMALPEPKPLTDGRRVLRGDFGIAFDLEPSDVRPGQIAITVMVVPEKHLDFSVSMVSQFEERIGRKSRAKFVASIEDARKIIADHLSNKSEE